MRLSKPLLSGLYGREECDAVMFGTFGRNKNFTPKGADSKFIGNGGTYPPK